MTKAEQIRQAKRRGDVKALRALRSNIYDRPGDYEAQATVPEIPDVREILEGKVITNVLRDPDHPTSAKIVEGTAG